MELSLARRLEEAGRLRQELTHIGRVSALGELTASLAHELNQPLTAIRNNAEVAQRFLEADAPDIAELREILTDIVADDARAAGLIHRVRVLLRKGELEHGPLDINRVVGEVAQLVRNEAVIRHVPLRLDLATELPAVRGDRAPAAAGDPQHGPQRHRGHARGRRSRPCPRDPHLRAPATAPSRSRSRTPDPGSPRPTSTLIFEPLYTTKAEGLGMGLAISRTIVHAHGGRVTASNKAGGGTIVAFALPVAASQRP